MKTNGSDNFVYGLHTVTSVLRHTPARAKKLFVARTNNFSDLENLCRQNGVPYEIVDRWYLEKKFNVSSDAQGVVLMCSPFFYCDVDELLKNAQKILILDTWQDAVNIGRAARAAVSFSGDGIIICKDRSAQINAAAEKSAVGALSLIPVARVVNLATTIKKIKEAGFFVYGADVSGQVSIHQCEFAKRVALVIGQEGAGLRELTKKNCDILLQIPMARNDICLNAADTALVLLYELSRRAL